LIKFTNLYNDEVEKTVTLENRIKDLDELLAIIQSENQDFSFMHNNYTKQKDHIYQLQQKIEQEEERNSRLHDACKDL
jgi:hypothetical protein